MSGGDRLTRRVPAPLLNTPSLTRQPRTLEISLNSRDSFLQYPAVIAAIQIAIANCRKHYIGVDGCRCTTHMAVLGWTGRGIFPRLGRHPSTASPSRCALGGIADGYENRPG